MANTVSTISYANTFGQWMVATDALIAENNTLAKSDYTKDSGTLYLSENTKNALQSNGNIVVQKQLLVQGVGSSANIDNNLAVGGQVYFSNTTLGLVNSGQANINGLLVAQAPVHSLSVANNTTMGGNTTIRYNLTSNTVQANISVNTATASITGTTYTNILNANATVLSTTASISGATYVDSLQANTSLTTPYLQSNNYINTAALYVSTTTSTGTLNALTKVTTGVVQANSSVNTSSITADTIATNIQISTPKSIITNLLDANSAAGFIGSLQTNGQLSVGGNFVINGATVYNSNTFTLNAGSSTGQSSNFSVNRGTSGANAEISWNEPLLQWQSFDGDIYSRIITENYLANQTGSSANSAFLKANSAYQSQNTTGAYANSAFLHANSAYQSQNTTGVYANSAYQSQNTTGVYANSAFAFANSAGSYANSAFIQANAAFLKANASYTLANTFANTFVGTTGSISQTSGVISFSSNNGLTIVATSANNLAISTSQDLRTTASPTFVGGTFSQTVTGATMAAGTSNTALATTAYVQNLANNAGKLNTSISGNADGNAGSVTNGVYTNQTYSDPSWITSIANTKISGVITASQLASTTVTASSQGSASYVPRFTVDAQGRLTSANSIAIAISSAAVSGLAASATTDTTSATNITSGTLDAARLPYSMNQAVATSSQVKHAALYIGGGSATYGSTGSINATDNITAYYSDDRLKTRLGTIDNALDKLCTLTGFYYQANETAQALGYKVKREVGVSAQDVQNIMPEIVVPAPIDDKYLTIHYEKLLPLVIEAIKELKAEVEKLKNS